MTDLDARVAALMKHVDALHPLYGVAIKPLGLAVFRANIENAIRAELQKPAQEEITDEQIESIALKHEAFGFGRVDERGLTTHGFDPDGLRNFAREIRASKGEKT